MTSAPKKCNSIYYFKGIKPIPSAQKGNQIAKSDNNFQSREYAFILVQVVAQDTTTESAKRNLRV